MNTRLANYTAPFTAADLADQRYDAHAQTFRHDAYCVADVWRWVSNGQCPFDDHLEAMQRRGLVTAAERAATATARSRDTAAFIAEYRAQQPAEPSSEERAEARAEFGPGEVVVDALSGRRYMT